MTNEQATQANFRAVEKAVADVTKPLARAPERIIPDKSFAPPDHRGIHELLTTVTEMLEGTLNIVRLVNQRLDDFDDMQNRFYKGEKR